MPLVKASIVLQLDETPHKKLMELAETANVSIDTIVAGAVDIHRWLRKADFRLKNTTSKEEETVAIRKLIGDATILRHIALRDALAPNAEEPDN